MLLWCSVILMDAQNIIIYNTADGWVKVVIKAKDDQVHMNQNQLAELFATFIPNFNIHIGNMLNEGELQSNSVVKDYLITTADGKPYNVKFYALDIIYGGIILFFVCMNTLRRKHNLLSYDE